MLTKKSLGYTLHVISLSVSQCPSARQAISKIILFPTPFCWPNNNAKCYCSSEKGCSLPAALAILGSGYFPCPHSKHTAVSMSIGEEVHLPCFGIQHSSEVILSGSLVQIFSHGGRNLSRHVGLVLRGHKSDEGWHTFLTGDCCFPITYLPINRQQTKKGKQGQL